MNEKRSEFQSFLLGMADYVKDGELIRNSAAKVVFITSSTQLPGLVQHYGPGSFAVLIGLEHIWQLSPSGTWVPVI